MMQKEGIRVQTFSDFNLFEASNHFGNPLYLMQKSSAHFLDRFFTFQNPMSILYQIFVNDLAEI